MEYLSHGMQSINCGLVNYLSIFRVLIAASFLCISRELPYQFQDIGHSTPCPRIWEASPPNSIASILHFQPLVRQLRAHESRTPRLGAFVMGHSPHKTIPRSRFAKDCPTATHTQFIHIYLRMATTYSSRRVSHHECRRPCLPFLTKGTTTVEARKIPVHRHWLISEHCIIWHHSPP